MRWQFVLADNLAARLIAWYGEGYDGYSHVDAILPDGSLLGARANVITVNTHGVPRRIPAGVQIRPPEYEKWTRRCIVELPCSPTEASLWEGWLQRQAAKDAQYDKDAIIGFLLGRRDHRKGHWICSALQTGALQEVKKLPLLAVPPSQITPNTLLVLLSGIGARWTVRHA